MNMRFRQHWTPDQDETIRQMGDANATVYAIAARLKRTVRVIQHRAPVIGVLLNPSCQGEMACVSKAAPRRRVICSARQPRQPKRSGFLQGKERNLKQLGETSTVGWLAIAPKRLSRL